MLRYVIRRLLQSIPIFFGITILSYAIMAASGNPVRALAFSMRATPEEQKLLEARLGVNDPLPIQYLRWLLGDDWMRFDSDGDGVADTAYLIPLDANSDGEPEPPGDKRGILRGDFGPSFTTPQRSALQVLVERLPATAELGIGSLIIGIVIGVIIGVLAAVRRGSLFDNITRIAAVIFDAIPVFWLGLMLIFIFGVQLGWLPLQGRCRTSLDDSCPPVYERLNYLVLPTFILCSSLIAVFSRYARASLLDVISQDYIRTAFAKGLPKRVVWFKHGARNALIPIATFLGPSITGILSGAAITESVFSWPGVGKLAVDAVIQRDYPVVMITVIYAALATILGYLLSDILYSLIDPRIRYE